MKRECWGCNRIVEPIMDDGDECCPCCGNLNAFGTAAKSCAWLVVIATLALVAVLALLALYATPEPSPWPVMR